MDTAATVNANHRAARAFARRLREQFGVEHVYLFGSQATGRAGPDSDFDFLIVGEHFQKQPRLQRHYGLHELYWEAGGDASLDLILMTPDEFESAKGRVTLVSAVMPEAIDLLAEEPAPA
jgi:predicted nucleotidyltransferase